jgi:hypothetical protein
MREAGEIVLNGFQLASDAKIIRYPDRYMDPRGVKMWDTVIGIMDVRSRDIDPLASLPGDP